MSKNRGLKSVESSKYRWLKLCPECSELVLLGNVRVEGQKEKCSAQGPIYLVMSSACVCYINFVNINNYFVNSFTNQSTGQI